MQAMACEMDAALKDMEGGRCSNMWEMYKAFWRPFGALLTDMEKEGMMVNRWAVQLCWMCEGCEGMHGLLADLAAGHDGDQVGMVWLGAPASDTTPAHHLPALAAQPIQGSGRLSPALLTLYGTAQHLQFPSGAASYALACPRPAH